MNNDTMIASPVVRSYESAIDSILSEAFLDRKHNPKDFSSADNGFSLVLEEIDRLKGHVLRDSSSRDWLTIQQDAIASAALLLRFIAECC